MEGVQSPVSQKFQFLDISLTFVHCHLSHLKMEIQGKKVAVVTYILKDEDGSVLQEATKENPFAFIQGMGQVLPAFDAAIETKSAGDDYEFRIGAEEGYGEYDEGRIEDLDPRIFAEAPKEYIVVGANLPMEFNGHTVFGTITEIRQDAVVMDFNHPLAGKNLHFSGMVLEVRDATPEELAHGHVHGPGGHHH
jgi:FKBP-type peptidyl-prolyl cis-trans isomerase SlyD